MKKIIYLLLVVAIAIGFGFPASAATKKPVPISGWLPYWSSDKGIAEAKNNLKPLYEINPFAYEVQADGTIVDALNLDSALWQDFFLDARDNKVRIMPTLSWLDGDQIFSILSSSTARADHERGIMATVTAYNFRGVDIDYENKAVEAGPYFSKFLTELGTQLHKKGKLLSCTIEPRTPTASRFVTVPADFAYANDYKVINKYCDEVKIMAYDQRNTDILLNKSKGASGAYYYPVADKDWVKKVIQETTKTIAKNKIWLGVPTYGYEWEVNAVPQSAPPALTATSSPESGAMVPPSGYSYSRIQSLTYADFETLAANTHSTPVRNSAGELSFTYSASSSSLRYVTMSDSKAIADKVALARQFGLKGVAVFKIDGNADPATWTALK